MSVRPYYREGLRVGAKVRLSRTQLLRIVQGQGLVLVLVGVGAIFTARSPYFLTTSNLLNIGGVSAPLGILALGETFLIISGGIDISVGSTVALSAVVISRVTDAGHSIWVGVVAGLLAGLVVGMLNGAVVVFLKLDPLVTTLGTLSVVQGLAWLLSHSETVVLTSSSFAFLGSGRIGSVPFPMIVFLVMFALALFLERSMVLGRLIYAVGGNPEAARLAGLRVDFMRFGLYSFMGLTAAIAGVITASQVGSASGDLGAIYLIPVVTAVILGGASLAGGRGSVLGTLVAVAILGILQNGFALLAFSSYTQTVVLGALLIGAVALDQAVRKLEAYAS